jgi:hypothetical protein
VLDDFEVGAFNPNPILLVSPGVSLVYGQCSSETGHLLAGQRLSSLYTDFFPGQGDATLLLPSTSGDDALQFNAEDQLGQGFDLWYDFLSAPLDLTAHGTAFSFEIESLTGAPSPPNAFAIAIALWNTGCNEASGRTFVCDGNQIPETAPGLEEDAIVEISDPNAGTIVMPFADLVVSVGGVDLTRIKCVALVLETPDEPGVMGTFTASIDDFQIVSDVPASSPAGRIVLVVLMLGVLGIHWAKRAAA